MRYGRIARHIGNLRRNWFLPVTAVAFFSLMLTRDLPNACGLLASAGMFVLAAMLCDLDILEQCRHAALWCHILAGGTALYLCMQEFPPFYEYWYDSEKVAALFSLLPFTVDGAKYIGIALAAIGFVFVYLCTVLLWLEITRIVREDGLLKDLSRSEWALYAALLLLSLLFITVAFSQSQAFYGTKYDYDIIYTGDSPILVRDNAYLALFHQENDLRQPLFAVFSAPFLAIPKLLARMLGVTPAVEAMLLDYVQVAMLLAANFMLARTMELGRQARVCFMILGCCTYTYLLFIVMMEQYLVTYFWLMLCLYTICKGGHPARLALWGAGGTLITSMILLLFTPRKKLRQSFGKWLSGVLSGGLEFLALMLAFRRLDIFLGLMTSMEELLKGFGGGKVVPLPDKLLQYIAFCAEYFFAPAAVVRTAWNGQIGWQLAPVTQVQLCGVIILVLAVISMFLCWDKKICRLSALWIAVSLVVLVGFGWGTQENGLILYTLYFGWPYLVLLFQLAAKAVARLRSRKAKYVLAALCAAAMAVINIPAMKELVDFAVEYYPA